MNIKIPDLTIHWRWWRILQVARTMISEEKIFRSPFFYLTQLEEHKHAFVSKGEGERNGFSVFTTLWENDLSVDLYRSQLTSYLSPLLVTSRWSLYSHIDNAYCTYTNNYSVYAIVSFRVEKSRLEKQLPIYVRYLFNAFVGKSCLGKR